MVVFSLSGFSSCTNCSRKIHDSSFISHCTSLLKSSKDSALFKLDQCGSVLMAAHDLNLHWQFRAENISWLPPWGNAMYCCWHWIKLQLSYQISLRFTHGTEPVTGQLLSCTVRDYKRGAYIFNTYMCHICFSLPLNCVSVLIGWVGINWTLALHQELWTDSLSYAERCRSDLSNAILLQYYLGTGCETREALLSVTYR